MKKSGRASSAISKSNAKAKGSSGIVNIMIKTGEKKQNKNQKYYNYNNEGDQGEYMQSP